MGKLCKKGIIVYTGVDTKIIMNINTPKLKISYIEKQVHNFNGLLFII